MEYLLEGVELDQLINDPFVQEHWEQIQKMAQLELEDSSLPVQLFAKNEDGKMFAFPLLC